MNAVTTASIVVTTDDDADTSYLEQDEFADRLAEYRDGDFGYVGVYLEVDALIPHGADLIIQTIRTPGLWGIESDSGEDYLRSVAHDEYWTLAEMLRELNCATPVKLGDIRYC
jgi:hypothetical protein